jgi:hypothetical protein
LSLSKDPDFRTWETKGLATSFTGIIARFAVSGCDTGTTVEYRP